MIYIKTDMKEMPRGCYQCWYMARRFNSEGTRYIYECEAKRKTTEEIKVPDWCPLVEMEIKESE